MTEKELQKIQTLHEGYGSHIDRGDGICWDKGIDLSPIL